MKITPMTIEMVEETIGGRPNDMANAIQAHLKALKTYREAIEISMFAVAPSEADVRRGIFEYAWQQSCALRVEDVEYNVGGGYAVISKTILAPVQIVKDQDGWYCLYIWFTVEN